MSRVRIVITAAWSLVLSTGAFAQPGPPLPEGSAYVRSLVKEQRAQDDAISAYSYDLEETRENLNDKGEATSKGTRRYQVYFVRTRPIRRLVARDGAALSAKEQASVDRKAAQLADDIRAGKTVSERTGLRLAQLFESCDFKTTSRTAVAGRDRLELEFEPRKGRPREAALVSVGDAVLRMLGGKVVIDEADKRVVRVEARSDESLSARVSFGVKLNAIDFRVEFVSLGDGVWLPAKLETKALGRAFFFKTFRVRRTAVYSNYRRFSVETNEIPR